MNLGIAPPIVNCSSDRSADWETGASGADLIAIAEVAERLGYSHVTASEHIGLPDHAAAIRGDTYWDALSTLSYLAARTQAIRLVTNVLVLGYHHPLAIAKRYGTLDRLSGGRVTLGVGVGTLVEEFELLGVPFDDRGPRADDALQALRASLGQHLPSYSGPFYQFGGLIVEPHAVQDHVPIWIGGRTRRSVRRAMSLADGWMPFGLAPDEVAAMLADADRPPGFDVVLLPPEPFDPIDQPEQTLRSLDVLEKAGATLVNVRTVNRSLQHCLEQLHALRELFPIPTGYEQSATGGSQRG
jgi:probable F420-dependent oxidoreductase